MRRPGRHRLIYPPERTMTPSVLASFFLGIVAGMLIMILIVKMGTHVWPWQIPPLTINGS